ncbi:exodeoxyribonuclease 7 large subunit [Echinicola pacifica]|uniref:Exodeoxyribonuclease 7 large subunit n=1 Tax=Echinicola pacifica TaxID=346377 RepID=A0A918Q2P6_9BACT|nr:exodeoxyribonuclease VII large subunit [Echinicola pacifica]GGZ30353.1 exodeoxyribonuclease 7 large subunit [Echinicola pacifica]
MQTPLTLSELNQQIQQAIDSHLSPTYWVVAEIGDLRGSPRGHAYLELVEKSNQQVLAKVKANIWAYAYSSISSRFQSITGTPLKTGMKVLAQVNVQFHPVYGLSLNVKDIDPNFTLGEKARRKQETLQRLQKEGLMQLNKQFLLPTVPQKIAVISSATAAGFGDFKDQVDQNREGYRVHYKLYPATMQGDAAVASIVQAIEQIEKDQHQLPFDLMIIIRGGGAQLDLDSFDEYDLARAIANTTLPVVTGIGHERDESIADLVAHTQMKTPTAVAEFILSGYRDYEDGLNQLMKQLERKVSFSLQAEGRHLAQLEHRLNSGFSYRIQQEKEMSNLLSYKLQNTAKQITKTHYQQLIQRYESLKRASRHTLNQENALMDTIIKDLKRLDPDHYLQKGYTRTEINGRSISKTEPKAGDTMVTYGAKLKIISTINSTENHE